jgi:uncharacterized membrane protein YfcA
VEFSDILIYIAVLFGGALAGFINTLAGNGSAITLALLTDLFQLPPSVANGTNRLGILVHSTVTVFTIERKHGIDREQAKLVVPAVLAGGILGGLLAVWVSNESFLMVYRVMLVILLISLILKPKRWLQPEIYGFKAPMWLRIFFLFCIGVYGGFIQMGMGIFLLAVLVLLNRLRMMDANALKLAAVLSYTLVIFWIFVANDLIHWQYGILLAVGQFFGGWSTAHYLINWKHADLVAYWVLVLVVITAVVLNYLPYFTN